MTSCCGSQPSFAERPQHLSGEKRAQVKAVKRSFKNLPPTYHTCPALRAAIVTAVACGIILFILATHGPIASFPQQISSWFQKINWTHAAIGTGGLLVLSVGAKVVIHRVKSRPNSLTKSGIGKLSDSDHWQAAIYTREFEPKYYYPGYIDTSTLDHERSGYALFYGNKQCGEHYKVSTVVIATAPLHAAAAIAYHVVRLVVTPFYILGSLAREAWKGEAIYPEQRRFEWSDIPRQWKFSIKQIVKAPFYATAQIYAILYSYIDPLNGRKLGALIETDWNNGIDRSDGFWSVGCQQSATWRPEGGGGPEKLGQTGFYAAGCHTPMARVHFQWGVITSAHSITKALHPESGRNYIMTTADTLRARYNKIIASEKQDFPEDAEHS